MPGQLIVCPCGTVLRGIGLEEIVAEGCDGVVTGATEEDVLAAAAAHAVESHGMAEVVDAIRAGITEGLSVHRRTWSRRTSDRRSEAWIGQSMMELTTSWKCLSRTS